MNRHHVVAFGFALIATTLTAACAVAAPRMRHRSGPYSIEVLVDGRRQAVYRHKAQSYILGHLGRRYSLRIRNRSHRRVEAVVTVDGRDVLDGKRGSWSKRGYLIPAYGSVEIDGWRISQKQVAAFRFSTVSNSYAARTGKARNVGVIGVALFPERRRRSYVPQPYYRYDEEDERLGRRDSDGASRSSGPAPESKSEGTPAREAPAPSADADDALASRESVRRRSRGKRTAPTRRPGLGTAFGERRHSPIREVRFVRANTKRPSALLGLRYNDRRGLIAMGVDLRQHDRRRHEVTMRENANPFPAEHRRYVAPPPGWY
jgi:hypothetical protein